MERPCLYLGVAVRGGLERALSLAPEALLSQFTQDPDFYLGFVSVGDARFLAKRWGRKRLCLKDLAPLRLNLETLLHRLVPEYPLSPEEIRLLATQEEQ